MLRVMDDMRAADIDFLTIGQYLYSKHHKVDRFVNPDEFLFMKKQLWVKVF